MNATATVQTTRILSLRRVTVTIVGVALLALGVTVGADTIADAGTIRPGIESGTLALDRVEGDGTLADPTSAVFDAAGAYPGMPAQRSVLRLANTGTIAAVFEVSVVDLETQGPRSLDEVLRVTVRDGATGEAVYEGPVSGLRLEHPAALEPGASAAYVIRVSWPEGADDDAYQGSALGFTIRTAARSANA
jgi:hypothetical protein